MISSYMTFRTIFFIAKVKGRGSRLIACFFKAVPIKVAAVKHHTILSRLNVINNEVCLIVSVL